MNLSNKVCNYTYKFLIIKKTKFLCNIYLSVILCNILYNCSIKKYDFLLQCYVLFYILHFYFY